MCRFLPVDIQGVAEPLHRQRAIIGIVDAHAHQQMLLPQIAVTQLDVDDREGRGLPVRKQRAAGQAQQQRRDQDERGRRV